MTVKEIENRIIALLEKASRRQLVLIYRIVQDIVQ